MIKRCLIKLGGASLSQQNTLTETIALIRALRQQGTQIILVHGGGPAINEELNKRGITWQFINGQRQTTPEMMDVIEEVLGNKVNSTIVGELRNSDIPAIPFSGAMENTLFCVQLNEELLQVGEVQRVNTEALESILAREFSPIPVVAPIGIGTSNEKYNINADWAATKLAAALKVDSLIFLTDQEGLLDENKNLIPRTSPSEVTKLINSGVIHGGMYTKVMTMIYGLTQGIRQVRVLKAAQASSLIKEENTGTCLVSDLDLNETEVNTWKHELI